MAATPTEVESGDSSKYSDALEFLSAFSLATSGRYDEAEAILMRAGYLPASSAELDLLARIAIQKADFKRARSCWEAALKIEPSHAAAKSALAELDSSWKAMALLKRFGFLCVIALAIALSLVGVISLRERALSVDSFTATRVASPPNGTSAHEAPPQVASEKGCPPIRQPVVITNIVYVVKPPRSAPPVPPPNLSILGCTSRTNRDGVLYVVFNDALFSHRCELNEAATERLAAVANALKKDSSNFWIVIEGHTDAMPMPANSSYPDNYSLGLARAHIIADMFKSAYHISPAALFLASAGENDPPFTAADDESQARNRTVVIRLVPRKFPTNEAEVKADEPPR